MTTLIEKLEKAGWVEFDDPFYVPVGRNYLNADEGTPVFVIDENDDLVLTNPDGDYEVTIHRFDKPPTPQEAVTILKAIGCHYARV